MAESHETASLPATVWLKINAVCDAFENAWQTGPRPQVSRYLIDLAPAARAVLVRELLAVDIEQRLLSGETPDARDYAAALPGDRETIEAALAAARASDGDALRPGPLSAQVAGEAAAAGPRVEIAVTAGPHVGRRFTLAGHDSFIVGRSRFAHLQLPHLDPYFSRFHFMIEVNPPHLRLMDLDSTNGTLVNGALAASVALGHGDRIQGGNTVLEVSLQGNWQGMPPEVARSASPLAGTAAAVDSTAAYHGAAASCVIDGAAAEAMPAIEGYQLVRELGHGGMGVVYLAVRAADNCRVAIKTIRPAVAARPQEMERFLRESRILARLRHPHIVSFLDFGQVGELLYLVMEYVEGVDTLAILRTEKRMAVTRGVHLLCQALEALDYAHHEGFVHRDVKPANLLVAGSGPNETCRLADFGLARVYHASPMSGLTIMGDIGGTVAYMPPEQITHYRDAKPPADQYAAAATLYHLLTGRWIFEFGELPSHKRLAMILNSEPVPILARRPDVPQGLAQAIHRALGKQPERRFADAAAFRKALLPFAQ